MYLSRRKIKMHRKMLRLPDFALKMALVGGSLELFNLA